MTNEKKLAEQIANAVDDFFFNPASVARYLSQEIPYTIDRVMELVAQIIRTMASQNGVHQKDGRYIEGLFLADELNKKLTKLQAQYKFESISMMKDKK